LRADDAGDVRPMAVRVGRIRIVTAGKIVGEYDPICDAVAVCIGSEKGMVQIDAGIDDDNRLIATINTGETGICPKLIQTDQRGIGLSQSSPPCHSFGSDNFDKLTCSGWSEQIHGGGDPVSLATVLFSGQ